MTRCVDPGLKLLVEKGASMVKCNPFFGVRGMRVLIAKDHSPERAK